MARDEPDSEVMWLVEEDEVEQESTEGESAAADQTPEDRVSSLEQELTRVKEELAGVRKELAKKTVELKRRDKAQSTAAQRSAGGEGASTSGQPTSQPTPAAPAPETHRQLEVLSGQVVQLETALAQKEEELEEARRLLSTQRRALRDAAAQRSAREAAECDAAEASRAVVGQAVEDELERLQTELAETKTRSELELRRRETEAQQLRAQLESIQQKHSEDLASQQANLDATWKAEAARLQERLSSYESEVSRLRTELQQARNNPDERTLLSDIALLNKSKAQLQREFEAFKEMTSQAARHNREEVAKLLEENASLHSRLAQYKQAQLIGQGVSLSRAGTSHSSKSVAVDVLSDQPPQGVSSYSAYAYQALESSFPHLIRQWEQQHKGMLPFLIVGGVLFLMLLVAVVRAAASTRAQHSGALCFLAKLGIRIGKGCGPVTPIIKDASQDLVSMIEVTKRHHDVAEETILPTTQQIQAQQQAQQQAKSDTAQQQKAATDTAKQQEQQGQQKATEQKPASKDPTPAPAADSGQQAQQRPATRSAAEGAVLQTQTQAGTNSTQPASAGGSVSRALRGAVTRRAAKRRLLHTVVHA